MGNRIEQISVPDIGGAEDIDVIEILVKPGDRIEAEAPLITLEGDKATMDVPAPMGGVVKALNIKVGDKVAEGSVILTLEVADGADDKAPAEPKPEPKSESKPAPAPEPKAEAKSAPAPTAASSIIEVKIPDIGGAADVDVIEVSVKAGDKIEVEDALITLEGDKATMDVPAPMKGVVSEVKIKVGDKVGEGDVILLLKTTGAPAAKTETVPPVQEQAVATPSKQATLTVEDTAPSYAGGNVHAGPGVRRVAHEFGVDLTKINGSGAKGRIVKEDVQQFVKSQLKVAAGGGGSGLNIAPAPKIDFAKFGEIEKEPLTKIQKLTGTNMARNWVTIPHVTQFGEADSTELEAFRQREKGPALKAGIRLTPLVFLLKAAVAALKEFPRFNASLGPDGSELILKKYFHIGVAVDTPKGLMVPVIRDVDKKGLLELAKELGEISLKAREKGLSLAEMQGGCFTISSLGGIGGTAFTPIINAPEVAILGVSRTETKPVYIDGEFQPRLMLPLSLSYDHRVIDGAAGARFLVSLSKHLSDIRTMLL